MIIDSKLLTILLLGAAVAFGTYKYTKVSGEKKKRFAIDIKEEANKLKKAATDADRQTMDYFNEQITKDADALKESMPKMKAFFKNLFKGGSKTTTSSTPGNGTTA